MLADGSDLTIYFDISNYFGKFWCRQSLLFRLTVMLVPHTIRISSLPNCRSLFLFQIVFMKKGLFLIAIVAVLVGGYFAIFSKKDNSKETAADKPEKQPALVISKNTPQFNDAFTAIMNSYYSIKDALVNWDSAKAKDEAKTLGDLLSKLPVTALQADSNIVLTAKNFASAAAMETGKLMAAKTITDQRREFSVLTDNLYSLINTVRYDKEVIYYDKCPMAFNDAEEAYWLSRDSAIVNPYLGNKHPKYKGSMVTCGDVEQTVNYAKAKK